MRCGGGYGCRFVYGALLGGGGLEGGIPLMPFDIYGPGGPGAEPLARSYDG